MLREYTRSQAEKIIAQTPNYEGLEMFFEHKNKHVRHKARYKTSADYRALYHFYRAFNMFLPKISVEDNVLKAVTKVNEIEFILGE